jgi:hypothetical protein
LVAGKHEKVVEELMAAGAHLDISDTVAASIFCEAAKTGNTDEIRLMAKCGADVSAADYDSRTGLHLAASEGQVK